MERSINPDAVGHTPLKGGALSRLAAQLCQNPDFREWLNAQHLSGLIVSIEGADDAAAVIRSVCSIESRAELDHDDRAARIFHTEIRRPFMLGRDL